MKKIVAKHAIWTGNGFEFHEKPIEMGRRTIVEIISCAFCGTDKQTIENLNVPGMSFGHEILAKVIYLGNNHKVLSGKSISVGDRVIVHPGKNCGECAHCLSRSGYINLCGHRSAHGHSFFSETDFFPAGGFSTYIELMDDAWLIPIPNTLGNDIAVLAEPLAIAVRAVDRALSGIRPDRDLGAAVAARAAIIGIGPIGYLIAYVLKSIGADVVGFDLLSSRSQFFNKHLGFQAFSMSQEELKHIDKIIEDKSPIKDFDLVFECAGTPMAFTESLLAVRKGGRVIELGNYIQNNNADIDPAWICRKELDIVGHVLANPYSYTKVFPLMNNQSEKFLSPLITKKVLLSQIEEILRIDNTTEMKIIVENDL